MNIGSEQGNIGTILLFRDEPTLVMTHASVLATYNTANGVALMLDRTLFYPEGGGQPGDSGSIAGRKVVSVTEKSGQVVHIVEDGPGFKGSADAQAISIGNAVELVLDAGRRRDYMQQHTAQHLLSAILLSLFGAPTVSMNLGAEKSTIDVDIADLVQEQLVKAESAVNEKIALDLPILIHLCPPEDPASFPLRKRPPEGEQIIRIVEISGTDFSPCCGTHAMSTLDLRTLVISGAEKYKGMMRLSFIAGDRAVSWLSRRSRILDRAAGVLGVVYSDLPERLGVQSRKLLECGARADCLLRFAARLKVELAISRGFNPENTTGSGYRCCHMVLDGAGEGHGAGFALECTRAFAEKDCIALVASIPDLTVCVASPEDFPMQGMNHTAGKTEENPLCSGKKLKDLKKTESLATMLAPVLKDCGGRGGGSGSSFRASFTARENLESFIAASLKRIQKY